jgi:hypothetical protein
MCNKAINILLFSHVSFLLLSSQIQHLLELTAHVILQLSVGLSLQIFKVGFELKVVLHAVILIFLLMFIKLLHLLICLYVIIQLVGVLLLHEGLPGFGLLNFFLVIFRLPFDNSSPLINLTFVNRVVSLLVFI